MKYMVAIDGSDNGHKAFEMAQKLIKENDILYLTTVVRTPEGAMETSQAVRDEAIKLVLRYEGLCSEANLNYESIVVQGTTDAREAIINMVEKYGIDVLILGTRGLSKIKKMIMGSVSSYCVQNSPCDVLVVK